MAAGAASVCPRTATVVLAGIHGSIRRLVVLGSWNDRWGPARRQNRRFYRPMSASASARPRRTRQTKRTTRFFISRAGGVMFDDARAGRYLQDQRIGHRHQREKMRATATRARTTSSSQGQQQITLEAVSGDIDILATTAR
jgi:hypothetical protein